MCWPRNLARARPSPVRVRIKSRISTTTAIRRPPVDLRGDTSGIAAGLGRMRRPCNPVTADLSHVVCHLCSTRGPMPELLDTVSQKPKQQRLSSLDGLRAISIALVLGEHSQVTDGFPRSLDGLFYWIFDSSMGVRFFFCISGFIITYLLLLEHKYHHTISLRRFYARRAIRILPIYYIYLGAMAFLALVTPWNQRAAAWIANLTFTTNYVGVIRPTGHLWSLAVEEQFYITWPVILCFFVRSKNTYMNAFMWLTAMICLAPFIRGINYLGVIQGHAQALIGPASFLTNCDTLSVGALAAVIYNHNEATLRKTIISNKIQLLLISLAIIAIPYTVSHLNLLPLISTILVPSLENIGFSILMLMSVVIPRWGAFEWLNWGWMVRLGVLSYSIYIWQHVFCTDPSSFGLGHVWWMSFPGWLVPVFVTAMISYYWFERPLLSLRSKLR